MKKLMFLLLCFTAMSFSHWQPNFETAKQLARERHQLILLNFSGSDWCGPCMRMRKEIFDDSVFSKMADTTLILVNADFPRNKKNQLPKTTIQHNEALAEQYNSEGLFPFTVLMDENGKVIQSWAGLPKENAAVFTAQLKSICDAHKK